MQPSAFHHPPIPQDPIRRALCQNGLAQPSRSKFRSMLDDDFRRSRGLEDERFRP
jgi:uncharacterized protein YneF (UPF0154 family)